MIVKGQKVHDTKENSNKTPKDEELPRLVTHSITNTSPEKGRVTSQRDT